MQSAYKELQTNACASYDMILPLSLPGPTNIFLKRHEKTLPGIKPERAMALSLISG